MTDIPTLDAAALAWFVTLWLGYSVIADKIAVNRRPMAVVMHDYRLRWMQRMLLRDNRMADVQMVNSYIRSAALFISTTLLILAGVVALLGQVENIRVLTAEITLAHPASRAMTEFKIFILIAIFVSAFFTFAWCLRQFNYVLIMVGAAPMPDVCSAAMHDAFPPRAALVLDRAFDNFNRGLRSYYFALALMPWFLHPALLFVSSLWVIAVIYRRDFRSITLKTMDDLETENVKDQEAK